MEKVNLKKLNSSVFIFFKVSIVSVAITFAIELQHAVANAKNYNDATKSSSLKNTSKPRTLPPRPFTMFDAFDSSAPACPTALVDWVRDDYYGQGAGDYSSLGTAKYCVDQVNQYMPKIRKPLAKPVYLQPKTKESVARIRNLLSEKFSSKIDSSYKSAIARCDELAPDFAWETQTKFYAVAAKLEKVNSSMMEEMAYIDSVIPSVPGILSNFECPPQVWPAQQARCQALRARGADCWKDKKPRMQALIEKTKAKLTSIKNLENLYLSCISKLSKTNPSAVSRNYMKNEKNPLVQLCLPYSEAIELEKNSIPWIRGEVFNKIATSQAADPRRAKPFPTYNFDSKIIEQAIEKQLKLDRSIFQSAYTENLESFRCLTNYHEKKPNCDFKKIRSHLQKWPDKNYESPFYAETISQDSNKEVDKNISTYFEAEKCLWEKGENRNRNEEGTKSVAINISLMAASFVGGEIVLAPRLLAGAGSSAALAIEAATGLTRLQRLLVVGNFSGSALYSGYEVQNAFNVCIDEAKAKMRDIAQPDIGSVQQKLSSGELACTDTRALRVQVKEKSDECMVNALVATASLTPVLGAAPAFAKVLVKTKMAATEVPAAPPVVAEPPVPVAAPVQAPVARAEEVKAQKIEIPLRKVQLATEALNDSFDKISKRKINLSKSTTRDSAEYREAEKLVKGLADYIADPKTPEALKNRAALAFVRWSSLNISKDNISHDVFRMIQNALYTRIYANFELGDDVRYLIYLEMQRQDDNAVKGLQGVRPAMNVRFETSFEIRNENTIEFLNRDIRKMPIEEVDTALSIVEIFPYLSIKEKREIFESVMAGRGVPKKYIAQEKVMGRWPPKDYLDSDSETPSLLPPDERAEYFGTASPLSSKNNEKPLPLARRPPESTLFKSGSIEENEIMNYFNFPFADTRKAKPAGNGQDVKGNSRSGINFNFSVLSRGGFVRKEIPYANNAFVIYVNPQTNTRIVVPNDPNHLYSDRELREFYEAVVMAKGFYSDAFKKWMRGKLNTPDGSPP